jgi:hypothetical protein
MEVGPTSYLLQAYGLRFTADPTGSPTVSSAQAISAATANSAATINGNLMPDVQVTAQYGTFSDDALGQQLPSGQFQLEFQDTPAWLVTFSGPGLSLGPLGSPANSTVAPPSAPKHEQTVVIDARTGAYMESFS